jgi:murein L,D-transpeptidase YcbB/YkuD
MSRICLALVLASLVTQRAAAQSPEPERELLRDRIEQLRANPELRVEGVQLAASRLVAEIYERRGFALEWTSQSADQLARAIGDVEADGLDPEDYLRSPLERARSAAASDAALDARIDCDVLETEALVRLLYHLILGKEDPTTFDPNWNFARKLPTSDPVAFVQEVIDSADVYERIEREKPQLDFYRRLKAAYARERERAAAGGWKSLPAGPTLKPGVSDSRIPALRARLVAGGDLAPDGAGAGESFDPALAAAVQAFQARHGLAADGAVGAGTLVELNVPIAERLSQLRVNLERARWILHDLSPEFVLVNVAGFEVYFARGGAVVWRARAQVGKPYRATPIFRAEMSYLVLNPTWTVPPGILAADILPAQRRDRGTLARKGLEVVDMEGRVVSADSIDWSTATPRNFRYMLRQPPGPTNALGRVKFMFPNPHSVYLHDTPSRDLFERSDRAFSSGCIRVDKPLELAAFLLEGQKDWDRAALDAAIASGKTRTITLTRRVPVLILYWTAWVDAADGTLQLRRDLYGRDAKVAAGLAQPFRVRARPAR